MKIATKIWAIILFIPFSIITLVFAAVSFIFGLFFRTLGWIGFLNGLRVLLELLRGQIIRQQFKKELHPQDVELMKNK